MSKWLELPDRYIFPAPSVFPPADPHCSLWVWLPSMLGSLPFLQHWFFCLAVQCQSLEAPIYGTMDCMHPIAAFAYGSRCKFECRPGYQVRGSDTLHCTDAGQWTGPLPTCEGKISFLSTQYNLEGAVPCQNDQRLLRTRQPPLGSYLFNLWEISHL